MKLSQFFISRPIFAGVLSALIFLAGCISLPTLPISEYPEVVPPTVVVRAAYPGANPKVIAETVATPARAGDQRRREHALQFSQATSDGVHDADGDLQARHRRRQGAGAGAEPRRRRRCRSCRRKCGGSASRPRRHRPTSHGRASGLAGRPLRHAVPAQLRDPAGQGRARAHARASARRRSSAPATTRCASGSIRRRSPRAA